MEIFHKHISKIDRMNLISTPPAADLLGVSPSTSKRLVE
jgi:hypothetical protein